MKEENEVKKIQNIVHELFRNTLTSKENDFNLSYPLIPRISAEYLKNRIVIVGQETNTWYNTKCAFGDYNHIFIKTKNNIEKEALIKRYDSFVSEHVQNYGGKFWDFSRSLYEKEIIDGNMVVNNKLSHCWINLFAMEACCDKSDDNGRPTKNKGLRNVILKHQGNLTYNLLKLLNPKLIIFLTGHSLDDIVCEYALNIGSKDQFVGIDKNCILETNHACQILPNKDSSFLNTTILRLYHPTYFMGRINTYKALTDKIAKKKAGKLIPYYISIVFDFLKKWKKQI